MGFFKDMRDLKKMGKEAEQAKYGDKGRPGIREAVKMSKEAVQGAQEQQQLSQQLMQSGVQAEATVKEMHDTGRQINMMPEITMELEVNVGGFTKTVNHTQPVQHAMIGMLAPGNKIAVLVDKNDHSKLMITGGALPGQQ